MTASLRAVAAATLLSGALAASGGAAQAPPDRERALSAFAQVAAVLTHPRCQNCHTLTDYPRQGDERRRHAFNVRRGPDGHDMPGMRCTACHGRANNAANGVPGADEDWHLAPPSMGWEGVPIGQMCRNLLDPARNGGRSGSEVIGHLRTHLVEWAWAPGRNGRGERSTPALPHDGFVAAAEAWIAAGAACPDG